MKKLLALLLVVSGLMVSCSDDFQYNNEGNTPEVNLGLPEGYGMLSFGEMQISIDESEALVRSTELPEVDGNYVIKIKNAEGVVVEECQYKDIKESSEGIALLEGVYTLEVCSTSDEIPAAAWEKPIYGATKSGIEVKAGQVTPITEPITCTLLQCKVTVDYNDDFLAMVKGACKTTIIIGSSLEYNLNWDATQGKITSYEKRAGYFDVNNGANTTMEVKFEGSIYDEESESVKTMRQSKAFEGIEARQWRQVRFVKKVNEEGNASFEIEIDGYVEDDNLGTEDMTGEESVLAPDPNAPKGDGGIMLLNVTGLTENTNPTKEAWNAEKTDKPAINVANIDGSSLIFKASIPNGAYEFYVDITSTNADFNFAVREITVDKDNPGRIYLTKTDDINRGVVTALANFKINFPAPEQVINKTDILFDLSPAVPALKAFPGTHTFSMYVRDSEGCTHRDDNQVQIPIKLTLEVEE
ncbi:MAG: DUF4493 domain-containing protein [Alistipes sp.]|nr:DUF4493 domain-containing protein [Alistipes sp.]